jgi:hypothetical protein
MAETMSHLLSRQHPRAAALFGLFSMGRVPAGLGQALCPTLTGAGRLQGQWLARAAFDAHLAMRGTAMPAWLSGVEISKDPALPGGISKRQWR